MPLPSLRVTTYILVLYVVLGFLAKYSFSSHFTQTQNEHLDVDVLSSSHDYYQEVAPSVPTLVTIPKFDLSVPVGVGTYQLETDSWDISDDMAYFADESANLMSDRGTTVIYAHNKQLLFGQISKLGTGDSVFITDEHGNVSEFVYDSKKEVSPRDTSVFDSSSEYKLVLLTCSSFLDQKRMLVYFRPATS